MTRVCVIQSACLSGVEAIPVSVEVSVGNGLPGMSIVGMADTAVLEARERVKAALRMSGFHLPDMRITVNLAPGNIRKTGSGFDLPIACGILLATGQIPEEKVMNRLFIGELSLQGSVRPVIGALAFATCAKKMNLEFVTAIQDPAPIQDLMQLGIGTLGMLHLEEPFEELSCIKGGQNSLAKIAPPDYKDICGHDIAKRSLQIAAAGNHCLLMMGPPGSGKTMLASRLISILPPLNEQEMLEAAVIHSVAGEDTSSILSGVRPFRSPHHSASTAGLIGGGSPIKPGEVSLAHCGVLFLDELSEFKTSTLQSLRQPIESGCVCLTRAEMSVKMPANFMMVAASNRCPCGYLGDKIHHCNCTSGQVIKYQSKIGGPLIDRISICLDVERLPTASVLESGNGTDSNTLKEGVLKAQEYASWRVHHINSYDSSLLSTNTKPTTSQIIESCQLNDSARKFAQKIAEGDGLSGRGLVNTLKVARTIADLEESLPVLDQHLAEAFSLRVRVGNGIQ